MHVQGEIRKTRADERGGTSKKSDTREPMKSGGRPWEKSDTREPVKSGGGMPFSRPSSGDRCWLKKKYGGGESSISGFRLNRCTVKEKKSEILAGFIDETIWDCRSGAIALARRKDLQVSQSKLGLGWIEKAGFSLVSMDPDRWEHDMGPQLYIHIASKDAYSTQWYLIPYQDLRKEPKLSEPRCWKEKIQPPPSPIFGKVPRGVVLVNSVAVALLPQIYVLGGGFRRKASALVLSYDVTSPHKGWERRPDMKCGRISPSAVALDGKIYVFGGLDRTSISDNNILFPYAEVYDPESDRWEAIFGGHHMDSTVYRGHAVFVDQYQNKNILVRCDSYDFFYTYNVCANSFTLRECFPFFDSRSYHGAVVDSILYSCFDECIMAYDLKEGEWFDEFLVSPGVVPVEGVRVFLFHIGHGRLCVTYAERCSFEDLLVTCSVVKMTQRRPTSKGGKATLHASLESFKRYVVPGIDLEYCLVL